MSLLNTTNKYLNKIGLNLERLELVKQKNQAELNFWRKTLDEYVKWYQGEIPILYGEKSPTNKQKIRSHNLLESAILTWEMVHQRPKYLEDLELNKTAFKKKRILDIGSGPHPSALVFEDCEVYCLDPLMAYYIEMGFPIHHSNRSRFVHAYSENIPFTDNYFDAVISVNAIDHVNNFDQTVDEIRRVLKPNGNVRLHVHYHPPTIEEPITLNDQIMTKSFSWCKGFKKISQSSKKRGFKITKPHESYTVWSN